GFALLARLLPPVAALERVGVLLVPVLVRPVADRAAHPFLDLELGIVAALLHFFIADDHAMTAQATLVLGHLDVQRLADPLPALPFEHLVREWMPVLLFPDRILFAQADRVLELRPLAMTIGAERSPVIHLGRPSRFAFRVLPRFGLFRAADRAKP